MNISLRAIYRNRDRNRKWGSWFLATTVVPMVPGTEAWLPIIQVEVSKPKRATPNHPELDQWPFQEPKLEVPTIYKAYLYKAYVREYPSKIWPEIWYSTSTLGSWNDH